MTARHAANLETRTLVAFEIYIVILASDGRNYSYRTMPQLDKSNLRLLCSNYCSRKVIIVCGALSILGTFFVVIQNDIFALHASSTSNRDHENISVEDASLLVVSRKWMKKKEVEFEARRARVKDVCATFDPINRWREKNQGKLHFWFDLKHGFAFCAQPKVSLFVKQHLH